MKNTLILSILRIVALVVLIAGAYKSLHYTLLAGQNNPSWFLRALFVVWVLLPFAALLTAGLVSSNWATKTRTTTYILMLVIAIGSFIAYSGMFSLPDQKPAAAFVIVPLLSLLLMMIVIPLSAFLAHKEQN